MLEQNTRKKKFIDKAMFYQKFESNGENKEYNIKTIYNNAVNFWKLKSCQFLILYYLIL